MKIIPVTSLEMSDPVLEPYRTLKTPERVNRQHQFVVQGDKSIQRLLLSPCQVVSILCSPRFLEKISPWLNDRHEETAVILGETSDIQQVIGYRMYQEVMAVARIPGSPTIDEVMMTSPRPWLFVALDGLTNAENTGTIIRNCSGFGVSGLISGETSSDPYLRRSVRCTMGTIFNIPIIRPSSLAGTLKILKKHGVHIIGTFPHSETVVLSRAGMAGDCCLVFGAEGDGVSDSVSELCDQSVCIPMHRGTDSLNVAAASAVFLYEANRQRGLA